MNGQVYHNPPSVVDILLPNDQDDTPLEPPRHPNHNSRIPVCAKYFQTEEKDKKMTSDTTLEPKSWVLQTNNALQFQRLSKKMADQTTLYL